ncbi:hypothetical protein ACFHW1_04980 [Micromonospora sp. LOL_014]|uniref:hypothetical protein n=1 Tax=Micromonospora sp. LOL_014 TaxID=3345415 RepID=UPI003A88BF3B
MSEEIVYLATAARVRPHRLPLPAAVAQQLAKGQVRRVNADGSEWRPDADGAVHAPSDGVVAPVRPADKATKAEWVAWAVHVDPDLPLDDAEAMTKTDLVDRYGK